jgi:hypothetical protein
MDDARNKARALTQEMRTSDWPPWRALRGFLKEQGIALKDAAMVERFPESQGDFGVLVTRDARVFSFVFKPGSKGDIRRRTADVQIAYWREEVTERDRFAYAEEIDAAMEVLAEE